ncbi:phage portal protein [Auraticoccus monumenti]|uniref:Phage portal protein, SPP1 Gp6-like n=1 Tax=Auraticoccus monumenti TaxID=675864 RepID=A0A1G6UJD8_9ACTN|nr:phage portal protein [Auraticoccus monumenti]SDD41423.1 Phage portal protein, SPP1 Gp6-like [Auraticoccus monumenti]
MVALPSEHEDTVRRLMRQVRTREPEFTRLDRYYEGKQRLEHIGLAVPPELRRFETVVNVPRMAVDEVEGRQNLAGFQRSGKVAIDKRLREAWDYNNLDSQSSSCHKDARLFGRSFVTVSTNDVSSEPPLITVESPEGFAVDVSPRRSMRAALRVYRDDVDRRQYATLYLPDVTYWLVRSGSGWELSEDADEHKLGRVPVVMFLNRPRTGRWNGVSEMADVMGLTDSIARIITNMQVAGETLALPHRWAAGMKKDDFVDRNGKPLPTWEAYMTAIKATENPEAKFGSFATADLDNFHDAVNNMLAWCAAVLGLPTRYAGQQEVNPASEGAIRADEARLIKNVERKNRHDGDSWAWVMSLHERFRTGRWPKPNSIRTIWHDPATPTKSQIADAAVKLHTEGILSREGVWDEMGWDETRKDRERAYFAAEALDPLTERLLQDRADSGA